MTTIIDARGALPGAASFDPGRAAELRAAFARWRADLDRDRIPVRRRTAHDDALMPLPRDASGRKLPIPARKEIGALGLAAQLVRADGLFTEGHIFNRALDRAVELTLLMALPRGRGFRQDHALAALACEAVFGPHLAKVWVEPPTMPLDRARDLHTYRLFVGDDWTTPVTGVTPPSPHAAWPDWRGRIVEDMARSAGA